MFSKIFQYIDIGIAVVKSAFEVYGLVKNKYESLVRLHPSVYNINKNAEFKKIKAERKGFNRYLEVAKFNIKDIKGL